MKNLNYVERIEKAEELILNRVPRGKSKQTAQEFKKLVSGLNVSVEFFIKSFVKNNENMTTRKKLDLKKKIFSFLELAEIKTTNAFFYKKNLNSGLSIECFIILL